MSFANAKETSSFTPAPKGSCSARLYGAIDLGTQTSVYGSKRQCMLQFELSKKMEDGQPFTISNFYSANLHKDSNLRRDLELLLDRNLTSDEIANLDMTLFLGTPCWLTIRHEEKDGNVRAKIAGISPLPEEVKEPVQVNDSFVFDLAAFNQATFEGLSEGLQKMITKSPEYSQVTEQKHTVADFDDDLSSIA